jgi:thioredoxin 2
LLPWLVDADPARFDDELRASVPVLVDLWAPWCGPCRWISPLVEEAATANRGKLKVVKVNADDAPGLLDRFGVRGIPTLIVFKDGAEVDRMAGAAPKADLEAWLARHVEAPAAAG